MILFVVFLRTIKKVNVICKKYSLFILESSASYAGGICKCLLCRNSFGTLSESILNVSSWFTIYSFTISKLLVNMNII